MKYWNQMKSILLLRQIRSLLLASSPWIIMWTLDHYIAGIGPYLIISNLWEISKYILYAYQYEAFTQAKTKHVKL